MLDGYHNSGSFCDFLGAFKQTPGDLLEFFQPNFIFINKFWQKWFPAKKKKDFEFQENTHSNFGYQ